MWYPGKNEITYTGGFFEVNILRSSEGSSSRRKGCCFSSGNNDSGMPASLCVDMAGVCRLQCAAIVLSHGLLIDPQIRSTRDASRIREGIASLWPGA